MYAWYRNIHEEFDATIPHIRLSRVKGHLAFLHLLRSHGIRGLDPDSDGVPLTWSLRDAVGDGVTLREGLFYPRFGRHWTLVDPSCAVFVVLDFEVHLERKKTNIQSDRGYNKRSSMQTELSIILLWQNVTLRFQRKQLYKCNDSRNATECALFSHQSN